MKVTYVEFKDHMTDQNPVAFYSEKDLDDFVPMVVRVAGVLLREDEESLVIGMAILTADNSHLEEQGDTYRLPFLILKATITRRTDFEISPSQNGGLCEPEQGEYISE